jgi:GNAT superfamily N-acetyltransferase
MASYQPPQRKSKPAVQVTSVSDSSYEPRATLVLARAFQNDAIFTYFMNKLPNTSRPKTLKTLVRMILTSSTLKHATIYESGSLKPHEEENPKNTEPKFECVAVFVPPGEQATDLSLHAWFVLIRHGALSLIRRIGFRGMSRMLVEFQQAAGQAKKKAFPNGEQYYYLFIVGTDPEHQGKGLCAATIKEHQKVAQEKKLPIWLEASNKGAMTVYTKVGFKAIGGDYVVGKGKCDAKGEKAKGAEAVGVEFFPMVWWPEGYVREEAGS